MLTEVSKETYRKHFQTDPHPYISEGFLGLVEDKAEKTIRLMDESNKSMGLVLGVKDNALCSPFSAPFGGFHFSHEYLFYEVIFNFVEDLRTFVKVNDFKTVNITLPPDIYHINTNAKSINALIRAGYTMGTPDITNWIDLLSFNGKWTYDKVANKCRRAIKHQLTFEQASDDISRQEAYRVIYNNRAELDRRIHMSLDDILEVEKIMPVDFFLVKERTGESAGAGIFYRGHEKMVQGIFMGDDLKKRDLGIIDFLYLNLYDHYKQSGYHFVDFGTSSQNGEPNSGLIRFKEIHNCATSLRHRFSWVNGDLESSISEQQLKTKDNAAHF